MSENDFDQMMDAVRKAMVLVPVVVSQAGMGSPCALPKAANDDVDAPWALIPIPVDWYFA